MISRVLDLRDENECGSISSEVCVIHIVNNIKIMKSDHPIGNSSSSLDCVLGV